MAFARKQISSSLLLILLLLLTVGTNTFAQTKAQQIKQLEQQAAKSDGTDKCRILLRIVEIQITIDSRKAEKYAQEALAIAQKNKDTHCHANALSKLGSIYYRNKDYPKAINYFDDELKLREKQNATTDLAIAHYNIASACIADNKERKAIRNFEQSAEYAHIAGNQKLILMCYEALFDANYKLRRYKDALSYFDRYVKIKDSTFRVKKELQITILKTEHRLTQRQLSETQDTLEIVEFQRDTIEKASLEKDLKISNLNLRNQLQQQEIEKEQLIKQQLTTLAIGISVTAILLLLSALLLLNRYQYRKKVNQQLIVKNTEIQQQHDHLAYLNQELKQQKDEITSSIVYAKRIQQAILPQYKQICQLIPEHFLLYKPRDIVSGDFYWINHVDGKIIFATADCTGHGVPGAFMSMLGVTLLNEIVMSNRITDADQILNQLRAKIKQSLKQTGGEAETKDGMDIALCVFDPQKNNLQFAGAYNPLYLIRNNELMEIKGTRNPVGIHINEKPFARTDLPTQTGDMIYLFSDGYVDQFGSPDGSVENITKFKARRFRELLLRIHNHNMSEQHRLLIENMEQWQHGVHEQIDDIIVFGVRL